MMCCPRLLDGHGAVCPGEKRREEEILRRQKIAAGGLNSLCSEIIRSGAEDGAPGHARNPEDKTLLIRAGELVNRPCRRSLLYGKPGSGRP